MEEIGKPQRSSTSETLHKKSHAQLSRKTARSALACSCSVVESVFWVTSLAQGALQQASLAAEWSQLAKKKMLTLCMLQLEAETLRVLDLLWHSSCHYMQISERAGWWQEGPQAGLCHTESQ
eukprot:9046-Amphidinium_carterae.3